MSWGINQSPEREENNYYTDLQLDTDLSATIVTIVLVGTDGTKWGKTTRRSLLGHCYCSGYENVRVMSMLYCNLLRVAVVITKYCVMNDNGLL